MQYRFRIARRSTGFTLIELLLVIGIIVVLLALIVGATMKGVAWVSQRNTELTFQKVLKRLDRRYAEILNDAQNWRTPDAILVQANGDTKRAEVLKVKYLYKWSFPINYREVEENYWMSVQLYDPEGYPPAVALRLHLLQKMEIPGSPVTPPPLLYFTTLTPAQQNSACLLAIFESNVGSSQDEFSPHEIGSQSNTFVLPPAVPPPYRDRNRWLVDAWASPIVYIRNANLDPTLLATQLGGATNLPYNAIIQNWLVTRCSRAFPLKQGVDAEDPSGTLRDRVWLGIPPPAPVPNGAAWTLAGMPPQFPVGLAPLWPVPAGANNRTAFQRRFFYDPINAALLPNQFASIYAPMVLFSAGPDRNFDSTWDNVDSYGLQLTVGDNR